MLRRPQLSLRTIPITSRPILLRGVTSTPTNRRFLIATSSLRNESSAQMASDLPVQQSAITPQTMQNYNFPRDKLRLLQQDSERQPLILVACGSFSPVTFLHLRMFEMASDFTKFSTDFELMGGYFSPVSDAYKKKGLASSVHRLRMCELACQNNQSIMVDSWEASQTDYTPTAAVLDHFNHEINEVLGGVEKPDGSRVPCRIALLAGADLIQTMSTPGVWAEKDLHHILGKFGTFIVERSGTDIEDALQDLQPYKDNIFIIQQLIMNDVSSTKIRMFLRREMSIQYLIPAPVIEYIQQHELYLDDSVVDGKGKTNSGRASPAVGGSSKS